MPVPSANKALKLSGDVTRSPKQGYQWPHKKTYVLQTFFDKEVQLKLYRPLHDTHPSGTLSCRRHTIQSTYEKKSSGHGKKMTVPLCQWRQRKNYHTIWYHSQFLLTNMNIYTRDYGDSHEELTYCLRKRQTRFFTCSFEKWLPWWERTVRLSHCIHLLWIYSCKKWLMHNKAKRHVPKLKNANRLITFDCGKRVSASNSNLIGGGSVCPSCNISYQLIYFQDFNAIIDSHFTESVLLNYQFRNI